MRRFLQVISVLAILLSGAPATTAIASPVTSSVSTTTNGVGPSATSALTAASEKYRQPSAVASESQRTVLAVGDSYNIGAPYPGQLTNPFLCARQSAQAGAMLAQYLAMRYRSVACGGAKVSNVLDGGQWGEPRQIDAVTHNVDLLVVSIGGNDTGGPASMAICTLPRECAANDPIIRRAYVGIQSLWNPETHIGSLATLYAAFKQRLKPSAQVLVSGYGVYISEFMAPHEFPLCRELVSEQERVLVNKYVNALNGAIQSAAEYYGFTYVDQAAGLSTDTGLCSAYGTPGKPIAALNGPIPLHPTYDGVVDQYEREKAALERIGYIK